jgi:hypothetical protein
MLKAFMMELSKIQPSQLYISSEKLAHVLACLKVKKMKLDEPLPIKRLGEQIVLVDGHTRAFAMFLEGISEVPVYWEEDELDWDAYRICVEWCKKEGINTVTDLKSRIIPHSKYKILWLERCRKMQENLEAERQKKS